jgi:hypothetical protein
VIDLTLRGRVVGDDAEAVNIGTQRIARTDLPAMPRYGWFSALGALLCGSIGAFLGLFSLAFVFGVLVHVLPGNVPGGAPPGVGWPWRIDGAWAVLADLGPLLVTGGLLAVTIGWFVEPHAEHPPARWPIALCATLVGWVPISQSGRSGLVGVSGGVAFLAMWWTTRKTSEIVRPRLPGTTHPGIAVAIAGVIATALAAASVSYAALHPLSVAASAPAGTVTLHNGRTDRFAISIYNLGPFPVRILGVSISASRDLRLVRVERPGPRTEGPTIDSLYSPAGTSRIPSAGELELWLTLAGPADCLGRTPTVESVDLRLEVVGVRHNQRADLSPGALKVSCRS